MAAEFLILGPLEIRHDGRTLGVPGGRRRALLAALLLRAGAPVTADWLIEALWGDDAALGAANALQARAATLPVWAGRRAAAAEGRGAPSAARTSGATSSGASGRS